MTRLLLLLAALVAGLALVLFGFGGGPDSGGTPAAQRQPDDPSESAHGEEQLVDAETREATRSTASEDRAPAVAARTTEQQRGDRLHGRVVPKDGQPVGPGARVRVTYGRVKGGGEGSGLEGIVADVHDDGSFEVHLPSGARGIRVDLLADFLGVDREERLTRVRDEPVLLEPVRGGCLRIEFTGSGAELAAEATVPSEGFTLSASGVREDGPVVRRAFRSEDGTLHLGGLPLGGAFEVALAAHAMVDVRQSVPEVDPMTYATCVLDVVQGAGVRGSVVDLEGQPVARAQVTLRTWERSDTRWNRGREVQGWSGEDGSFEILGALPGPASVLAQADGLLTKSTEVGQLGDGDIQEGVLLQLDGGDSILCRVLWPDGKPAKEATVTVTDKTRPWRNPKSLETDEQGEVRVGGLVGRSYAITATARQGRRGPRMRAHGEALPGASVELVLGDGIVIRGRVVDDMGTPLDSFTLNADPLDEPGDDVRTRVRDGEGAFELSGFGPGRWDFTATAKGHGTTLARRVVLPAEQDAVDLVLPRLAAVSGVVTSPDGEPVSGARVAIGREKATADGEGRFTLEDLEPGDQDLQVDAEGHGSPRDLSLHLEPGEHREDLVVALSRGSRVLGRVHPERWTGTEAGALLRLAGDFEGDSTPIDGEGRFTFEGLDPGDYLVRLDLDVDGDWSERFSKSLEVPVTVPPDADVEVVLGDPSVYAYTVHGVVRQGGEPAPGMLMYIYKPDEETKMPRQITRTDAEGRYELTFRQTGAHSFCVGEGQARQALFRVNITGESRQEENFEIPGCRLRGRVRTASGAPAPGLHLMLTHSDTPSRAVMIGHTAFTFTGADGSFEFINLHPGTYRFRSGNYVRGHSTRGLVIVEDVVVDDDPEREELEVVVPDGALVDVRAVNASGKAMGGCAVELLDPNGRLAVVMSFDRTDSRGWLRSSGVGPGTWDVVVRGERDQVIGRGSVTVAEGGRVSTTVTCQG